MMGYQEMMGWQWHQLDHMQVICTLLQTDNHASTSSLIFYMSDAFRNAQPTCQRTEGKKCPDVPLRNLLMRTAFAVNLRWHITVTLWCSSMNMHVCVCQVLCDTFVFKIIPMLNPDGVIVGNYRCSLTGRDLNRAYRVALRDSFPSISHTKSMIKKCVLTVSC